MTNDELDTALSGIDAEIEALRQKRSDLVAQQVLPLRQVEWPGRGTLFRDMDGRSHWAASVGHLLLEVHRYTDGSVMARMTSDNGEVVLASGNALSIERAIANCEHNLETGRVFAAQRVRDLEKVPKP